MADHGTLWRGIPDELTEQDDYPSHAVHVPLPQDITEASADLLFGDKPTARVPGKGDDTDTPERRAQQEVVDHVYNTPHMQATLLEGAEVASAFGGVYLRVGWDAQLTDRPVAQVIDPISAVPVFRFGRLASVTFWTDYETRRDTYRLLEEHTPGRIEYALYKGRQVELGQRVPLEEVEAVAHLARIVDAGSGVNTGTDRLTAIYVKNQAPNRLFRTGQLREYGRSDFAGAEHLFTQLDGIYGSWMRDIRLARARLIVDEQLVEPLGGGRGAEFDEDREVFTTLEIPGSDKGGLITPTQFAIRVEEHRESMLETTALILRRAGLAESTFGAAEGLETATGIKAKERMSVRTRAKKIGFWRTALAELIMTLADVNSFVFGGARLTTEPDVRFPKEAQLDLDSLAGTLSQLRAAQAMSVETMVRMVHPDWDSQTVNDEVARIKQENGLTEVGSPDLTNL
jgi:hypothetical protein